MMRNLASTAWPVRLLKATAGVGVALLVAGPVAPDSAATAATESSVSITFDDTSLQIGARATADVCTTKVPTTWATTIQEQEGTAHLWTSIANVSASGTKCTEISLIQEDPGRFTFRTSSVDGTELVYRSAVATVTVYRPVPYQVVCTAQSDCHFAHGSGSEEINSHVTNYLDRITDVGVTNGEYIYSLKSNSCRTMTLGTVFLHDSETGSAAPGDSIAVQVVQHTLNPQSVQVSYVPRMSTFDLDGGPVDINVIGITGGEQFVLISGELDCYTLNGAPEIP